MLKLFKKTEGKINKNICGSQKNNIEVLHVVIVYPKKY